MNSDRIFLIGFMGSGKTTFGRKLASRLNYKFIDLDEALEKETGMSIPQFFQSRGEDVFRDLEKEILQRTAASHQTVISTGGGLPCFHDNMDWMNENGITVYISLTPKALAGRLDNDQVHDRPVLEGKRGEELVQYITEKLSHREPFYKRAHYEMPGIDLTAEKVIEYLKLGKDQA